MTDHARNLQALIFAALNTKYGDRHPTEAEFNDEAKAMRNALQGMHPVSDESFKEIVNNLQEQIYIIMDKGICIYDKNREHQSWLPARRADIDFKFWNRYRQYLLNRKSWNARVISSLDELSDTILDLLGDPRDTRPFQRRGLIIGEVQSGKTANFTALCNKAADAGYRVIVVLTGIMENLRRQTQERLDYEFSGRSSRYMLDGNANNQLKHEPVGVGSLGAHAPHVAHFTSVLSDFNEQALKNNGLSLKTVDEKSPVLLVVKKNKKIISNLTNWLKINNITDADKTINLPLLVIDDEADSASINTSDGADSPSAINSAIRGLLSLFDRASYVGVTATPFANIFIDPDSEDEMVGEDLFPRDFIYALDPPDSYIGANAIFGSDDGESEGNQYIVQIDPDEFMEFLPDRHSKRHKVQELPLSMKDAMAYFILTNGIRDIRNGNTDHRSMMIHVTRFTDVQEDIRELVYEWLAQMCSDLKNYAKISGADVKVPNIVHLKQIWERFNLDAASSVAWDVMLGKYLYKAAAPIEVRSVNQASKSKGLDYHNYTENGMRVIAVGGNSLSRGLTLEGLCVSYFYRKSMMFDTLMQMCRWFGYRPNYKDLMKVWISEVAVGWYQNITSASNELRDEIIRMQSLHLTPKEFGLKVRRFPASLIPTAKNKMRATKTLVRPVTVAGQLIESPRLRADPEILHANAKHFCDFISSLADIGIRSPSPDGSQQFFWSDVPKHAISSLLRQFDTHPLTLYFQGSALADYIDQKMESDRWDVVIPQGSADPFEFQYGDETITVKSQSRKIASDGKQILISGSKVRVGSGGVAAIGLSKEMKEEIKQKYLQKNPKQKSVPDSEYLHIDRKPIMILHAIHVDQKASAKDVTDISAVPQFLFAIGLGFPSMGQETETATYVLNMVELSEWMDIDEERDD